MRYATCGLVLAACLGLLIGCGTAAERSPVTAKPAAEPSSAAGTAKSAPAAPKTLDEEDLSHLPVLGRFNLPFEKGRDMLADVKDDTFSYDEPAFYWLIELLSRPNAERLTPGPGDENLPFEQLMATPSSFRGQIVTLQGVYARVSPWKVPVEAIARKVPTLYTCEIREEPLDRLMPVATVIVLEDPMPHFKMGDEVRVKGYFYKVRQYEGDQSVSFAPMIIAQRIEPAVLPVTGGSSRLPTSLVGLFKDPGTAIMLALILVMVIAFFFIRSRVKARSHATSKMPYLRHRFRLQRDDRTGTPGPDGTGSGPSRPQP